MNLMPDINSVRFYTGKWGIESHSKILFSTYIISNNLDNIFPQNFFNLNLSVTYLRVKEGTLEFGIKDTQK